MSILKCSSRNLVPNVNNTFSSLCVRVSKLENIFSLTRNHQLKPFTSGKSCSQNMGVKITILTSRVCRLEKLLGFFPIINTKPGLCGGFPNPQSNISRLCGRIARIEKLLI